MRIIDLTQTLEPGLPGFSSEPSLSVDENGWNATTLHIYSHAGTHIDAPSHFRTGEDGIDKLPLVKLMADCHVIDLPDTAPSSLLTPDCLGEKATAALPGEGLLFRTGWSRYINDRNLYRNALPRISEELAKWIIRKKIRIIGVEPPSVADVNNIGELTLIHTLFLDAGVVIVEGLVNLDQIRNEKVKFIALPLKIKDCDGSPCRAIAIEEN
ncbi:MAG: cyclase family protein [Bacteroidales bacterium]|nr:cyclase family protein [Bacteroidales bacterium]